VTKQSFAYVLDRTNGKPVWPIEERPVPQSTVPGEKTSATQPIPTKPPPFDRQGVTIDDLIDFTPELRAEAIAIIKRYVYGPVFTPPSVVGEGPDSTKGTIELPGSVGGADWTGAAFDPNTKILYVPSMTNPFVANLIPGDPKQTDLRFRASTRALPCKSPLRSRRTSRAARISSRCRRFAKTASCFPPSRRRSASARWPDNPSLRTSSPKNCCCCSKSFRELGPCKAEGNQRGRQGIRRGRSESRSDCWSWCSCRREIRRDSLRAFRRRRRHGPS